MNMPGPAPEAVRLVIWDLDDTFWQGTLTEGGVTTYRKQYHDIVIELARRGIISSICSKNDKTSTLEYLKGRDINDYFVFPSINWESKGPRLAALVETAQLRPATVMFIDDNPNNRAEAAAFVPDLQIEDETFIPRMLRDPRFRGKDDAGLSRLAQYKLIETRKADEAQSGADNSAFLRGCDIRVFIEPDVQSHLDRAIELIQRTNQLNFTKERLPQNIEHARGKLLRQLGEFRSQAGLIRLVDKYGDYGFVGFYLLRSNPPSTGRVQHYCFSCRTLGMGIERWVYDLLGRPELHVVGDVLGDLSDDTAAIDWVRLGNGAAHVTDAVVPATEKIRLHGACEAAALSHYLRQHASVLEITSNFVSDNWFVALNAVPLLLSACDRAGPAFQAETCTLDLPYDLLVSDFFDAKYEDFIFVFCAGLDGVRAHRYRHRTHGWDLRIDPAGMPAMNLLAGAETELLSRIGGELKTDAARERVAAVARHMRANYDLMPGLKDDQLHDLNCRMLDRLPNGARFIFVLDSTRVRDADGALRTLDLRQRYGDIIRSLADSYAFASVVAFDDVILGDSEILAGPNHYSRMVYQRLAQKIFDAARDLPGAIRSAAAE